MTQQEVEGPVHIVVMGVAGSGKSTVARDLAASLGWDFCEGDDLHPQANVDKMASGRPLTDTDRWPWLEALAAWVAERHASGRPTVMTCSALRRAYRDVLRAGAPGTAFVHLVGDKHELLARMTDRAGHFMPPDLLESQLDTLEQLADDEDGTILDVGQPPEVVAAAALEWVR